MLNDSDANLMALRQRVAISRKRIEDCIFGLDDLVPDLIRLPQEHDRLTSVILELKYINDFILGE